VVRRLSRAGVESFSVGIECIGESVEIGEVTNGDPSDYTISGETHTGLDKQHEVLLSHRNGESTLVLDPISYQPDHILTLRSARGTERIRLTTPLQHGEGWMEAAFQKL